MTQHVEDDPILQVSSQEPSASSKYDFKEGGILETLLFMLESWNLAHKSRITYHDDPWCQEWPELPSIQSVTFLVLQVWLSVWGVLDSLLITLESWNLVHMSRITYYDIHIKNPYIWAKLCHYFSKFSGLVPEGPPNCRYMVPTFCNSLPCLIRIEKLLMFNADTVKFRSEDYSFCLLPQSFLFPLLLHNTVSLLL